jgi:glucose/mannose transport system substrate-binding protein
LEIFSWWTNGGEADGLNAMYDVYKQQNPGIEIVNATVAGGAGTNAKAVLQTRLQGNQPPDSWQVHAGRETLSYVDYFQPLTQFFKDEGLDKVMPKLLLDQLNINGEIYTVPVNIHRSNMLWYNPKIFKDNNLTPPKTLDEFFTVAEALKAKGITPLAMGGKDGFEASHLFESVLLATFGPDDYTKLWTGDETAWADERVLTAINTMGKMLTYANSDRSAIGWADAAQMVIDGKAGMTIMGDWAEGYFLSKGAKGHEDYEWAASPGTDGVFLWLSDSFGLAKGAPHPDAATAWLKVCGSKEGQDAFNPKKGSIPARTDADKSKYDEYLQWSIDQFGKDKLAPSAVHGAATTNTYQTAFHNALEVFSANPDATALASALTEAVPDLTR